MKTNRTVNNNHALYATGSAGAAGKAGANKPAAPAAPAGKTAAPTAPGDTVDIKVERGAALTSLSDIADVGGFGPLPSAQHIDALSQAGDKIQNRHEELIPRQLANTIADVIFGNSKVA